MASGVRRVSGSSGPVESLGKRPRSRGSRGMVEANSCWLPKVDASGAEFEGVKSKSAYHVTLRDSLGYTDLLTDDMVLERGEDGKKRTRRQRTSVAINSWRLLREGTLNGAHLFVT